MNGSAAAVADPAEQGETLAKLSVGDRVELDYGLKGAFHHCDSPWVYVLLDGDSELARFHETWVIGREGCL